MSDKKAPARGTRKSIVDEYKVKARGKKTSHVVDKEVKSTSTAPSPPKRKNGKKKEKKKPLFDYDPTLTMTVGDQTYTAGDTAWYVLEGAGHSKRPRSGEIKECYPGDKTEPCILVIDDGMQNYRTIRIRLVGWDKAEAKDKWSLFVESHPLELRGRL